MLHSALNDSCPSSSNARGTPAHILQLLWSIAKTRGQSNCSLCGAYEFEYHLDYAIYCICIYWAVFLYGPDLAFDLNPEYFGQTQRTHHSLQPWSNVHNMGAVQVPDDCLQFHLTNINRVMCLVTVATTNVLGLLSWVNHKSSDFMLKQWDFSQVKHLHILKIQ